MKAPVHCYAVQMIEKGVFFITNVAGNQRGIFDGIPSTGSIVFLVVV
jgi:hypothetical protein